MIEYFKLLSSNIVHVLSSESFTYCGIFVDYSKDNMKFTRKDKRYKLCKRCVKSNPYIK